MKKTLLVTLGIIAAFHLSALDASVSYATFKSPEQDYIEIYLHVSGKTVDYQMLSDSNYQAGVQVVFLFKQGEDIIKFDKFNLNSPPGKRRMDFIDVKRYGLSSGEYKLVVAIQDLNNEENAKEYNTEISINYNSADIQQSDIQLVASYEKASEEDTGNMFVKNGLKLEPLPYNFYGRYASSLVFYNEFYNTEQQLQEDFMVSYSIERIENNEAQMIMIGHKRQQPKPIIPFLMQMDISQLPSGNYNLNVELRNRSKELLSSKSIFFQRSNPLLEEESERIELADIDVDEEFVKKLNIEQLEYSLRALTPKMPQGDVERVNTMIKKDNFAAQRLYLFSYWARESPTNPEFAYKKYMEVVAAVDDMFDSGFRHGFETDRGYFYLKYGQPDDIERRDQEPSAPPYEVWSYYELQRTNQNNVRIVFYNPSLSPGDYELLHSDIIGERNNPTWQRDLYRDAPNEINSSDPFGDDGMLDNFNRRADRVFRDY